jgi:hypothetical protein
VDGRLITNEIKRGDFFAGLKRQFCACDDDPATVVAAHDIHCDSHSEIALNFALGKIEQRSFLQLKNPKPETKKITRPP